MTGMNRRSMMIYSSPQAKFKGTKHNGRIHRYGAFIFGDNIVSVSKSINEEKQIFWRLYYIVGVSNRSIDSLNNCFWLANLK